MKLNFDDLTGEIKLSAKGSLISGHVPRVITSDRFLDKIMNNSDCETEKFGLFDYASPNYSTYYPDVKAEDLKPTDEDFINPVFRLLSEVIVSKGRPIDFGKKGVLRKSMKMLLGQTVNIDHEVAVGNAIGSVAEVFWQESYKSKDGKVIPAGINGRFKIDGKSNPRIARGIMMEPPSIHSNSVTVQFKWEPSHKFEEAYEFYEKLGTYDKDGELVRCIVSEIVSYAETSLVSHGADPYAQKVNEENNEIVNPGYAERVVSFSEDKTNLQGNLMINYKDKISLDRSIPVEHNNNSKNHINNNSSMEKLIEQLISECGFTKEDFTTKDDNKSGKVVEVIKNKLDSDSSSLEDLKNDLSTKEKELEDKETEFNSLKTEKEELEKDKTKLDSVVKDLKSDAVKFYKLAKGDKAEEGILTLIENADFEAVKSLKNQYQTEANEKLSSNCGKCGKTIMQNGVGSKAGLKDDEEEEEFNIKSTSETRQSLREKMKQKSRLFNETRKGEQN